MNKQLIIYIKTEEEELIPQYSTEEAAGADLRAHIKIEKTFNPGESILIPTGIFLEIPKGYEAQIRPRSGLALKYGITVLNSPGTIDTDYRGEIKVILINHGKKLFVIRPKMRIAQLVLAPFVKANFVQKKELLSSNRQFGGFGHTGIS